MDPRIEELLPFYVLDALTDEERELVESYLAEHPEARQQMNDLHSGASALAYGISPVEPPRHVKKALMARVTADADARARSSAHTSRQPSRPLLRVMRGENILRTFTLGIATLAIVWVIILNTKISQLQNEIAALNDTLAAQSHSLEQIIANLPKSPPVITVSLKGTDVQPDAHGQLIADPKEQTAVLVISGLPKLEANRAYQVWLISGGGPVSAGLLTVDENGQGVLIVTSDESIGSFKTLAISVEPKGGSPQPTGEIVVASDL